MVWKVIMNAFSCISFIIIPLGRKFTHVKLLTAFHLNGIGLLQKPTKSSETRQREARQRELLAQEFFDRCDKPLRNIAPFFWHNGLSAWPLDVKCKFWAECQQTIMAVAWETLLLGSFFRVFLLLSFLNVSLIKFDVFHVFSFFVF